jgi:hypothetical protein
MRPPQPRPDAALPSVAFPHLDLAPAPARWWRTRLARAACSRGSPVWLARGSARRGLLARLARVVCPRQHPTRSARVARPRRRGVARPTRPARVHGAQRATCLTRTPSARPAASLRHPAQHARLVHPRLAYVGLCGARPTRSRGNPMRRGW